MFSNCFTEYRIVSRAVNIRLHTDTKQSKRDLQTIRFTGTQGINNKASIFIRIWDSIAKMLGNYYGRENSEYRTIKAALTA